MTNLNRSLLQQTKRLSFSGLMLFAFLLSSWAQKSVPLYRLPPSYPVPYQVPDSLEIHNQLKLVLDYLEKETPMVMVEKHTGNVIADLSEPVPNTELKKGDFHMVSYEWGVTYAGMMAMGAVTGDPEFTDYTAYHLDYIRQVADLYRPEVIEDPDYPSPVRSVLLPRSLDDAGSMCAAMIKARLAGINEGLDQMILNYMEFIEHEEYRLDDGTLARRGVQPNTIWLDDLFMSVPALAQMGVLSGEKKYFNDAVNQVLQFSERMFNKELGLYMHTWSEAMETHPEFRWARANGWAIMAMVELLEVLPEDHEGRDEVLKYLRAHIHGLWEVQDPTGFWHQLLDRNNTYLETSATAIFTYSVARAVNRGYVDAAAYGPMVVLAWNALTTRINEQGQVTGTCVGTGMGFDYAFYAYRPQSPLAAHGYGPVLLAGAEMIALLDNFNITNEHLSIQFYEKPVRD